MAVKDKHNLAVNTFIENIGMTEFSKYPTVREVLDELPQTILLHGLKCGLRFSNYSDKEMTLKERIRHILAGTSIGGSLSAVTYNPILGVRNLFSLFNILITQGTILAASKTDMASFTIQDFGTATEIYKELDILLSNETKRSQGDAMYNELIIVKPSIGGLFVDLSLPQIPPAYRDYDPKTVLRFYNTNYFKPIPSHNTGKGSQDLLSGYYAIIEGINDFVEIARESNLPLFFRYHDEIIPVHITESNYNLLEDRLNFHDLNKIK